MVQVCRKMVNRNIPEGKMGRGGVREGNSNGRVTSKVKEEVVKISKQELGGGRGEGAREEE